MSSLLLCGQNGLLGSALDPLLPLSTLRTNRSDLDFTQLTGLSDYLYKHQPRIIINTVAYTQVDQAQSQTALCNRVNHQAVAVLANYARQTNALLVHFSTDYVFDGKNNRPYTENDLVNPINIYGQSKYLSEQAILHSGCAYLIFRLGWLYGTKGHHFVRSIMQRALNQTRLSVVDDQIGTPTAVDWLAPIILAAIQAHQQQLLPSGLYHLSPAGQCSWYEFALEILNQMNLLGLKTPLCPAHVQPAKQVQSPLIAPRPHYSVLNSQRLLQYLQVEHPQWQQLLPVHVQALAKELPSHT